MSKKHKVRHRYKGALATPLRPGECIEVKLELLLKDLGASDRPEGFKKLALRHVDGCRQVVRAIGNRKLDPATESQFREAVWSLKQESKKMSLKTAVRTIYAGLESSSPVRDHTVDTMYAYCKEWRSRDRAYEKSHDEKLEPFRRKYEKLARAAQPTQEGRLRLLRIERDLGRPSDIVLPARRVKRGRR